MVCMRLGFPTVQMLEMDAIAQSQTTIMAQHIPNMKGPNVFALHLAGLGNCSRVAYGSGPLAHAPDIQIAAASELRLAATVLCLRALP